MTNYIEYVLLQHLEQMEQTCSPIEPDENKEAQETSS